MSTFFELASQLGHFLIFGLEHQVHLLTLVLAFLLNLTDSILLELLYAVTYHEFSSHLGFKGLQVLSELPNLQVFALCALFQLRDC